MWLPFATLGLTLAVMLQAAEPVSPPQRFRSSVDVVQVDVSAIDDDGQPIAGLTAADFEVRVDGHVRPITSVQFVTVPPAEGAPAPASSHTAYASNADAAGGRLIMLVVDRSSIASGRGRAAIDAASRFVTGLNHADRVALASIPDGPQVAFTVDHELVQRRILEIDGTALPSVGPHNLGIADALAFERRSDLAMQTVLERECGSAATGPGGRGGGQSDVLICNNDVRSEAAEVAADARERARQSIEGLKALLDSLPPSQTPKLLVLISEGLVVDRETAQLSWIEARAAAAHVTIYSLMLDRSQTDASQARPDARPAADRALQEQGLEFVAQASRGDVFHVLANSDFAFERLQSELSGYYLLGFAPAQNERDGRAHAIKVSVKHRGVTVRSRRQFRIAPAAATTTESEIVSTLRDPLPAAEIPLELAAYSFRDPVHDRLQLLVAAEIDRAIDPDARLSAGYVVVDFDGTLAASQLGATLPPPNDRGVQQYFSTAALDPGKYTVKLAVVDDAGRRGSVELRVDAHLTEAGPIRVSDLLIADAAGPVAARPLAPVVGGDISGDTLYSYLELFAEAPDALGTASVTLEVAAAGSSAVLQRVPIELRSAAQGPRWRVAAGRLDISSLPAGDYVARAVVAIGLDAVGEVSHSFRLARNGKQEP